MEPLHYRSENTDKKHEIDFVYIIWVCPVVKVFICVALTKPGCAEPITVFHKWSSSESVRVRRCLMSVV